MGDAHADLEICVLGPVTVRRAGATLPLGGPRQRLVLALLILDVGRTVPADRLVDLVWGATAPATQTGPLRTHIWQLRRLLGASTLHSRPGGYVLDVDPRAVDSVRFEQAFADARTAAASGYLRRALAYLDTAIATWDGPAFGDLATEAALQAEATRLDQLRLSAIELRADLLLATGQHDEVAGELGMVARANPGRERLWAMLMTALYRSGRQADALRCYQEARSTLIETLGIEPGPELRELEQAVLVQDPGLDWVPRPEPEMVAAPEPASGDLGLVTAREPHSLPLPPTSFVGRGEERAAVADALAQSRLVTLTGSGGCGKTRLAIAVASDVLGRFGDGVHFVDLSAVTDPGLVPRAFAEPLGVETEQGDQLDHVCKRIGRSCRLFVVDNCEHLLDAVGPVLEEVLRRCPAARILATSREELRIAAETVWRVPAMSLPDDSEVALHGSDDPYLGSEAVELFVERGRAKLADFAPSDESLATVVQICRQLDGIPLAIELAAAMVGSLPLGELARRLDQRLGLLAQARRHGPLRHRTLRDALDWSFDLLEEPAQRLFVRLGVFVGDFTLAAVERVAGNDDDPLEAVRALARLVQTSMVVGVSDREGTDRYRLLETVRHYAHEKLEEQGLVEEMRLRHARYYAEFAAEAERYVHGPDASTWRRRVGSELPNLRAAMEWAFSHDDLETGLRLAGSLHWYFARMMLLEEAARWLDVGLQKENLRPELRLMALTAATMTAYMQGEFRRTRELGEEAVTIARQLDDRRQLAVALIVRGAAVVYEGDLERAEECFAEADDLCRQLGDRWSTAWMLTGWATASRRAGDRDRARRQLEEALSIFRAMDDRQGQVLPLVNLALAAQEEGRFEDALAPAQEAAAIAAALGDRQQQHLSLCLLGRVELSLGHHERGRDLLVRSIRDYPGAHNHIMLAIALEGLAELASRRDAHGVAAALFGFTQEMRSRWQISASGTRSRELDACLDRARDAIGAEQMKLELERGRSLTLDDAVALAVAASEAEPGSALPS